MSLNWQTFGTNSAQQSGADMFNHDHYKSLLSGAVCEYLDDEKVEEFLHDLFEILLKESETYARKAQAFNRCAQVLEKGIGVLVEEEKGNEGS